MNNKIRCRKIKQRVLGLKSGHHLFTAGEQTGRDQDRSGRGRRGSSAFPRRHDSSLDLGEAPQRVAEENRRGSAEERKLSDVAFDMPFCMRAVLEEDNVTGAVAGRRHRIVFKNESALEDQDGLV